MTIPSDVRAAIARMKGAGYLCYPVGGCVRDLLLLREPHDWDLCTSALPEQTYACFAGLERFEVGAAHGTVGVVIEKRVIEITTFRVDLGYTDGRHPDKVRFAASLREDLARRDFTINAMALDEDGEVIDFFGGREDLAKGLIRCVGDPHLRFREDALRILRGLRFASRLGFAVEEETARALRDEREGLGRISRERILSEWEGILCGTHAARVIGAFPSVISTAFPKMAAALADPDRLAEALARMEEAESLPAREARFLFGLGLGEEVFDDEPISRTRRQTLAFLIAHEADPIPNGKAVRAWLRTVGEEGLSLGRLLWEGKEGGDAAIEALCAIERDRVCFAIGGRYGLAIGGGEVAELTGANGRQIREMLEILLNAVVREEIPNTREALCAYITERNGTIGAVAALR